MQYRHGYPSKMSRKKCRGKNVADKMSRIKMSLIYNVAGKNVADKNVVVKNVADKNVADKNVADVRTIMFVLEFLYSNLQSQVVSNTPQIIGSWTKSIVCLNGFDSFGGIFIDPFAGWRLLAGDVLLQFHFVHAFLFLDSFNELPDTGMMST